MQASIQTIATANRATWAGRAMSGFAALFLAVDGVMKLFQPEQVTEAMQTLGYSERLTTGIGALLLTGYLGGAVASQARIEDGLFTLVFPLVIGALFWAGLALRDERVRALVRG